MSDGMNDARALDDLAKSVQATAVDLAEAIEQAHDGHRGLSFNAIEYANQTLSAWGLRLEKIK